VIFCSYLSRDVGDLLLPSAMAEGRFCERLWSPPLRNCYAISRPLKGDVVDRPSGGGLKGYRMLR
jgi:hypothetical protein